MDFEKRIKELKSRISTLNDEKIRAETQQQSAEKQLAELKEEMSSYGVTPDNIGDKIKSLESEISEGLDSIEKSVAGVEERLQEIDS